MASTGKNGKQIDADILQCKADILRSCDTVPPNQPKPAQKEPRPAKDVSPMSQEQKQTRQDKPVIPIDTIRPNEPRPPASAVNRHRIEPLKMPQEQTEIPRFDLAEEIMAEQRKITAIKRKAPDKKIEYQIKARIQEQEVKPISYTIEQMVPSLPEQEKIIAEIVARDIQRLCRG